MSDEDRSTRAGRLRPAEIAIWGVAAALQCGLLLAAMGQQRLGNDGYQYLSVVDNLSAGHGIATNLVHFDIERAHGTIPAPLTTFPAGFPLATAALHATGMAPETAGVAVSLFALGLAVALLGLTGNALGFSPWLTRFALFTFAANTKVLFWAGAVASEMLFTALVVAAMLAMVKAERAPALRKAASFSVLAGILLGLCYWTRYAGLFIIAGAGLAVGGLVLIRRTARSVATAALTMIPALALCGIGLARNIQLTGTWKGGNDKVVQHPLVATAKDTITSLWHLVLGDAVSLPARVAQLVVVATLGVLVVRGVRKARPRALDPAVAIVAVTAAVYSAVLFYVARNSVISYEARMFVPVLPLLIVLFAALLKPLRDRPLPKPAIAAGLLAYLSCAVLGLKIAAHPPDHAVIASRLALPMAEGPALRGWLDGHLGPGEPVLAADGQATGYVLKHPVVSLVGSEYSTERWNQDGVEQAMDRFKIRYLLLYPHADRSGNQAQAESLFLSRLVAGEASNRMTIAARNEAAIVYERRPRP